MNVLSGNKTYIVAGVMVVLGLLNAVGITIPGVQLPNDWVVQVLGGLGLASLRAGVAKGPTS